MILSTIRLFSPFRVTVKVNKYLLNYESTNMMVNRNVSRFMMMLLITNIKNHLGRYDRAPGMLSKDTVSEGGRVNWTPNMIEHIRCSTYMILKKII